MLTPEMLLVEPGTVVAGRFEVRRYLGAGAMGSVFEALDLELGSTKVALKLLNHSLSADERQVVRFKNEVLLTRELNHPNIVRLFESGSDDTGRSFVAMELVDGCTLRELLDQRGGELSLSEILQMLYDLALGIAHAHDKGVLHRDLKPENVLIGRDGALKIADFGIARRLDDARDLTKTGETLGTIHYMAPEQISGAELDHRADIYAFGIIAYEALTGTRPFEDASYFGLVQKLLHTDLPALRRGGKPVASVLEDLIHRAAARRKEDRFRSMREVAALLDGMLHAEPSAGNGYVRLSFRRKQMLKRTFKVSILAAPLCCLGLLAACALGARLSSQIRLIVAPYFATFYHRTGLELPALDTFMKTTGYAARPDALVGAVSSFNRLAVEVILETGVDPNQTSPQGATLVSIASAGGNATIVALLADKGARLNVPDWGQTPPLIRAIMERHPAAAHELIFRGANIHLRDSGGKTALMAAASAGVPATTAALLARGAEVNARDPQGMSALMHAMESGNNEVLSLLIQGGADLSGTDTSGRSPLMHAVSRRRYDTVSKLLAHGANQGGSWAALVPLEDLPVAIASIREGLLQRYGHSRPR